MSPKRTPTVFYGAIVNPKTLHKYQALPKALLGVSPAGIIDWLEEDVPDSSVVQTLLVKNGYTSVEDVKFVVLGDEEFIVPGFIDTHTHAPQYPNAGIGQQYELLDWLDNITFPMEARFKDVKFARETYKSVVRRVIDCGTTTCCYYGTLHLEATKELANVIHEAGQRAFVGKCNMNRESPSFYVEPSTEASVCATKELISHIRTLSPTPSSSSTSSPALVQPILTPRFAISCTSDLLSFLGDLAATDPTLRIQTHISENPSEIKFTHSLFPNSSSYADVYDTHNLLRHNTILAHGVYLTPEELALIKTRGAGISHCPTSNFNLSSGVAHVGSWLDMGLKVGLGTDVSGGFAPSILTAVQHASIAAKVVSLQAAPSTTDGEKNSAKDGEFTNKQLTIPALLYLATLGGARVCDLDSHIGSFQPGKAFDALLVNVGQNAGTPGLFVLPPVDGEKRDLDGQLEKFLFCGDDRNIKEVYVAGRVVGGTRFKSTN